MVEIMAEQTTTEPITAPAGKMHAGSRFALWFFRGVAGFLAVTAALKLFSVVAELPLLRSSDPVLPFLTVRQSTFAAALLELGIACWLFRRSVSPRAPWVILWLVAIFTAYRLGLHEVGYKGPCNCYGQLPNYFPLSRPWLEWLGPLALVAMGGGSLWMILRAGHAGHNTQGGISPRQSRSGSFLLLLATILWQAPNGRSAETNEPERPAASLFFGVKGSLEEVVRLGPSAPPETRTADFSILVSNTWWSIALFPHDEREAVSCEAIPDGVRIVSLNEVAGNTNALNIAVAYPHSHPPFHRPDLLALWMAFCPDAKLPIHQYSDLLLRGIALPKGAEAGTASYDARYMDETPLFFSSLTMSNTGTYVSPTGVLSRFPPPFSQGFLRQTFNLIASTNIGKLLLPLRARLIRYYPDTGQHESAKTWPCNDIRVLASEYATGPSREWMMSHRSGKVNALDFRFGDGLPHGRLSYIVTNDAWPSTNDEVLHSHALAEKARASNTGKGRHLGIWGTVLLVFVIGIPPGAYVLRRRALVRVHTRGE